MATKTIKIGNRTTVVDGKSVKQIKKYNVTLYYHTNLTVQVEAESEEAARKAAYAEAEKECYIPKLIEGLQEDSAPDVDVDEGDENEVDAGSEWERLKKIKTDLETNAERYGLRYIEFTDEDTELVDNLIRGGVKYEDALNQVLRGISETLSE
jgi:hypothetical protein